MISVFMSETRPFDQFYEKLILKNIHDIVFLGDKGGKMQYTIISSLFGQESLPRLENSVLTRFTVVPGPQPLFPLAPLLLRGTNISGSRPTWHTRFIYNHAFYSRPRVNGERPFLLFVVV